MPADNKGVIQDPLSGRGDALLQMGGFRQGLVNFVDDLFTFIQVSEQSCFAYGTFRRNVPLGELSGVFLYSAGCEQFPRGPVPHRLRLAPLLAENKDGRLVFADLPQDLYRLADGQRGGPNDDGRFIINKPPGMPNQHRLGDRQPKVPDDQGGQEGSDTDTDVQKDHGGQEGEKEREVADNYRGYGEDYPGEHPQ